MITNSQGERMAVIRAPGGIYEGEWLLVLYDDEPSEAVAAHLIDQDTIEYLTEKLEIIKNGR